MSKKLLTLRELSQYLQISEEKIIELVDKNIIVAYKIGGELLRFRKEQIDAIMSEIDSRVEEEDILAETAEPQEESRNKRKVKRTGNTFFDSIADFFYFNDFYIVSIVLIAVLLMVIFKG